MKHLRGAGCAPPRFSPSIERTAESARQMTQRGFSECRRICISVISIGFRGAVRFNIQVLKVAAKQIFECAANSAQPHEGIGIER